MSLLSKVYDAQGVPACAPAQLPTERKETVIRPDLPYVGQDSAGFHWYVTEWNGRRSFTREDALELPEMRWEE